MKTNIIITTIFATLALLHCSQPAVAADDLVASAPSQITSEKQIQISKGCRIERYTISSACMGKDIKIAVVLPPEYDQNPEKRYPVVYTLHGYKAPYDTYANMSRLHASLTDMPVIYTCFDGSTSSYLDSPDNPKSQYKTFFFDEFVPFIDANYRLNGQRGITGFSMGGFGTMYYTLIKPEMFVASCPTSAGFMGMSDRKPEAAEEARPTPPHVSPAPPATPAPPARRRGRRRGPDTNVYLMLRKAISENVKLPKIMFRCGTEDRAIAGQNAFTKLMVELNAEISKQISAELPEDMGKTDKRRKISTAMKERGIDFQTVASPGGHNWDYWHAQAPEFTRFFWYAFQADSRK